jgi:phenylalanyl-tRNA synthetase beta chain
MPTIDVRDELLAGLLGEIPADDELERLLSTAKAEVEGYDPATGVRRVELKDTSRPDLWSTPGLARHMRCYGGAPLPDYPFMTRAEAPPDTGQREVHVDPGVEKIRPGIAAFAAAGPPLSEPLLLELIQSQEKLCDSYGQRRRAIAMGIYRGGDITWPVRYRAAPPDTRFVPLGFEHELSLIEILDQHPKGRDYGHIVRGLPAFPYLEDAAGRTLSFPPIINSADLGNVAVGDSHFLVELTGPHLETLLLVCAIAACDLADAGYEIFPVTIRYPYATGHGRDLVTPLSFQRETTLELATAERLLGETITPAEGRRLVERMGSRARIEGASLVVTPPPYRNDFLHAVDVVEEIAIGRGLDTFEPELPEEFTAGHLTPQTHLARAVREVLVGLGYQEMIFNYLGARRDYTERMNAPQRLLVEVANPMTESYAVVRDSIIPNLLAAEMSSQNAAYPHHMFEVGKVALRDAADPTGSRTVDACTLLVADGTAGFNDASAHLAALLFYLGAEHRLVELDDPRFIPGRAAQVEVAPPAAVGQARVWTDIGVIGELHPAVLEQWSIGMPCAAAELHLDVLRAALNRN